MRVIAGVQKGRRLHGPKGGRLRPTAAGVKEALFSILGSRVVGSRFLDLYGGTGAVGIEALSRGACRVTFVESDPAALRLLRANLTLCGIDVSAEIRACPADAFLARPGTLAAPHDIVFADSPYRQEHLEKLWSAMATTTAIAAGALVVLEHSSKAMIPASTGRLLLLRQYRYGDTTLSVFTTVERDSPTP